MGVECRLKIWLQSIDQQVADEFRALLWDQQHRHIRHTTVEQILTRYGCDVPAGAVGRHRRLQCAHCETDASSWTS
jgi:hypothetical protein